LEGSASPLLHSLSRISQDVNAALNQESSYNQRLALTGIADRLNGLSLELNRSSDRYAKRFCPIVNSWREILTNHVRELAKTAELHQEIDSPYIIGVPLTEQQAIFIGRTDITAQIEQLLLDQRRPPLLLYGQRRMGKTSLLYNLGRLLPNTIVPLFVDLQGPATRATDHAGLLYNIARKMVDLAKRQRGITLLPLTRDALKADPFTRFDEWLDDVELALEKNTVLFALDEFEALDRAIAKGRFEEEDVLGMLRNLIQHRPRFKVLLAGSHTLEEFQRWASYLINVQVIHISYLKQAEARQLIEQPVKDFALRYEPEALQRVLELTRCHPFLVQLLCAEIVALKNEQTPTVRRLAKLSDLEAAIPEALERGSLFFADIETNQVDAAGLEVLCFLAAEGEGSIVSREALSCKFPNELDSTLNLLLRRELIEEEDEGYRFQVELIRRWFALAQKT
ncbi:MAG: ATP-binding protein, partial [Moorea sp. SIO4G2]|nr:ATP-binding protein [Moorena sp. SIO4G2]